MMGQPAGAAAAAAPEAFDEALHLRLLENGAAVLHANLATVHIVQGDLAQASQCAHKALELQPDSRNALLCLVYLEIRAGNLDAAREILTKHVVPSQPLAPAAS